MLLLPLAATACTGPVPAAEAEAPGISGEPAPGQTPAGAAEPLPAGDTERLSAALDEYAEGVDGDVSAAVYEVSTGRTWYYNRDGRYLEASLVKVPILLTLLRQATDAERGLTAEEKHLAAMMIEYSDNPSTTALYELVGGAPELSRTYELLGVTQTEATEIWGANDTGVEDQLRIARAVDEGVEWIDDDLLDFAVGLMENVDAGQRWGISAGVAEADAEVALKNGWLQDDMLIWNVGSAGFVRSAAAEYAIVVLSAGALTMEDGVSVVEDVARLINTFGAPATAPATAEVAGAAGPVWRQGGPDA